MPPEAVVPGLGVNEPALPGSVKMTDQGILVEVRRGPAAPQGGDARLRSSVPGVSQGSSLKVRGTFGLWKEHSLHFGTF